MKWIAIAGGWRKTNTDVEKDVRTTVRKILDRGDGIVTGGALGVDYLATNEVLKNDNNSNQIKLILPCSLETYSEHYRRRADEGAVTEIQAKNLINQFERLKQLSPNSLLESKNTLLNKDAYFESISKIIEAADELVAFHINNTEGTQNTIDKAKVKGIPTKIFTYSIA